MFFKDQPILSTRKDAQRETRTKEFLEQIVEDLPACFPIGQHHDMAKPHCGYMRNFRVVPVPKADHEWMIIADVELESGTIDDAIGGISWGFTANCKRNHSDVETAIYLPYPYYNDEQIINKLLETPIPLEVGKWHKKSAGPDKVALIVSFILFAGAPLWQRLYDSRVHPFLLSVARKLRELAIGPLEYHYGFHIKDDKGRPVPIYIIPAPHEALWKSQIAALKYGLEVAMEFVRTDPMANDKGLYLLKLRYDSRAHKFVIFSGQFRDGTTKWYDD
jgi:hypothetical protein